MSEVASPTKLSQHPITYLIWALLIASGIGASFQARWSIVFISSITFLLTLLPIFLVRRTGVRVPRGFIAAIVAFITGTLFLGEVEDFYERFWWWDVLLHTGSAVGFGMIGTVLVLFMLRGDKLKTPPIIASTFAFAFAVAIGAIWEIFEFSMDQLFGLNMQKSGLRDTMGDLIVDCIGAFIGAFSGYRYLKRGDRRWLSGTIGQFVRDNLIRPQKK